MSLSLLIVYISWTEESLHEPMYIFICNLFVNVIFGSSAFYPKLFVDLFSRSSTISLTGCLSQAFCVQTSACIEIFTFTAMAFDRYLAVGHPLRYPTLMANLTSQKLLLAIWVFSFMFEISGILLTARLTFCSENIDNLFCEVFSLQRLACGDISINSTFGTSMTLFIVGSCVLVIIYSYIRTVIICLRFSVEASQKATQTLVTHLMAFSTFMLGSMFLAFRYRLSIGSIPMTAQVVITLCGSCTAITVNPFIYGIRTQLLRGNEGFFLYYTFFMHNLNRVYGWDNKTVTFIKKAQQRMYHLQQLKKCGLLQK
ncbi:olfactory receptor 1500-like [Hyperolius riggenbachi]|uniref:olfactory receptor 1500-like n=1 Tax=Hyperolius riggenbachi TaxID=752182 RepID=UPI0035A2F84B